MYQKLWLTPRCPADDDCKRHFMCSHFCFYSPQGCDMTPPPTHFSKSYLCPPLSWFTHWFFVQSHHHTQIDMLIKMIRSWRSLSIVTALWAERVTYVSQTMQLQSYKKCYLSSILFTGSILFSEYGCYFKRKYESSIALFLQGDIGRGHQISTICKKKKTNLTF